MPQIDPVPGERHERVDDQLTVGTGDMIAPYDYWSDRKKGT